jgi:ferredoxin-type protein NapF
MLVGAIIGVWPSVAEYVAAVLYVMDRENLPLVVPALSPFVALSLLAVTRTFQAAVVLGLLVGIVALVRRRWFCRWMCPTGLCADGASRLGRGLGLRCPPLPMLGSWITLATLAGACFGYPLFLWLDPLALFASLFNLLGTHRGPGAWWSALGLPAVLLLSVLAPALWCGRLCPLGATQDLLADLSDRLRRILPRSRPAIPAEPGWQLSRRLLLGTALGSLGAVIVRCLRGDTRPLRQLSRWGLWSAADAQFPKKTPSRSLRPPGAIDEVAFTGLCVRCGNCIRSCPTGILSPDPGRQGILGLLAPLLSFRQGYCLVGCTRCADVCPSGALHPFTSASKIQYPIGLPLVDMRVCLLGEDRECFLCRNHCPYEAITLVWSETDYMLTPKIDLQKCPGCGACEVVCPTSPGKAIVVHPFTQ